MSNRQNPYAPPVACVSSPDVQDTVGVAGRLLYIFSTGLGVALIYFLTTILRVLAKGQSFDDTPWFEISLIGVAFLVLTSLEAGLASIVKRSTFSTLSRRSLVVASLISVFVISIPINAEFEDADIPDWLILALLAYCRFSFVT